MAPAAKPRQRIPINRDVLRWARARMGLSHEDAADAAGLKPEQIRAWEAGLKAPTVKQARKLADVYDRPFLEFLGTRTPPVKAPELVPDFRMHRELEPPKERYELVLLQSEAEEICLNAIDLCEMLGEEPPHLPEGLFSNVGELAEEAAARAREIVGPPVSEQISLRSSEKDGFTKILRRCFEAAGIIVVRNSSLSSLSVRGMLSV